MGELGHADDLGRVVTLIRSVVVVIVVVEDGRPGTDGQHDGAVCSDGVGLPIRGASRSEFAFVFLEVVTAASGPGVHLICDASLEPFVGVVDLTPFGRQIAARMLAMPDQEQGSLWTRTDSTTSDWSLRGGT